MNKEYASTHIEYIEVPNYVEPKERLDGATSEFFKELGEYSDRGKEYVDSIESEIKVLNPNKSDSKEQQKKKKQHKKMIQNMVYTVASVATVAVLTQTAEPDKLVSGSYLSQIVSEQKESIAGVTIVFDGNGELTKEDVEEKLSGYELDGNLKVVIKEGITGIGDSAFAHYDGLVRDEIPDSVKIIGNSAFNGSKNLKLEKLTTTGRTIENNAFSGVSIGEVEISESLVVDRYYTFRGANINQVSFEEGISVLPAYLFNECDSIEEVRIPSSVTEIGDSAFAHCDNLKAVEIPSGVSQIGRNAFGGCKNLTLSVHSGSYAEQYAIEEEVLYRTY